MGESHLFLTPVLTLWGSGHIDRHFMEASYCTFGFGSIIRRDLRTLLLPRDSPKDNLYECLI